MPFVISCHRRQMLLGYRVFVVVGLVAVVSACKSKPQPEAATLAVLTDLSGVTEPCGCTSKPLGGLDHVAGRLETFTQAAPTGLVVVGNTFFTFDPPPATLALQERAKAQAIARILRQMRPQAVVLGPMDTRAQRPILASLLQQTPLPVLWQQVSQSTITLGGTAVGLVGVSEFAPAAAINAAAATLRQRGARLVVALVAIDTPEMRRTLAQIRHVDAVVLAGAETPGPPQHLENTVLLSGGSKGEYLGVLALQPRGDGPWTYYDGGASERATLQARRARLQAEADNLPEGPARAARLDRVKALNVDLAKLSSEAPPTSTFSWSTTAIEASTPVSAWAKNELAAYNRALCAPVMAESARRTCVPAADPRDAYAGNSACQACHAGAWEVYSHTAHARAWKTLTDAGKDCDLGCVGCHTIGYERPGGFCHLADAPRFANVGCENCHGPGAGHVAHPQDRSAWSKSFVRVPSQATCETCHTHEHSDKFQFQTYLPKILGPGHRALTHQ